MSSNVSIEVDKLTADKLQARAAELGVTVPQLIAELPRSTATLGTRTARRSPSLIAGMPGPPKAHGCPMTEWCNGSVLGYASVPTVAGPVELEWSLDALADLDRFATFLHDQFPDLAARVANELITRADVLRRHPKLGRPIATREEYREIVLQVLGGTYVLQYWYDGRTILMLRAFHSRESRE